MIMSETGLIRTDQGRLKIYIISNILTKLNNNKDPEISSYISISLIVSKPGGPKCILDSILPPSHPIIQK